ncbi:MAG: type 4a pilus biogenesis protein PilO [Planctomycetota bacterium]|jgi:type IV pilus assembly protein PilO
MRLGIREFIFMFVLLAMPVSSWWFVFRPQNEEIQAAKKEIQHKELMLERLAAATAQTEDLARANEEISEAIGLVESRLPDDKEVEVILEQVADLARKSQLTLPKVKTGKPVTAAKYMEQPLEMTIVGDFDDFYRFMLKLEKLDRITRMLDLTLERVDKRDGVMRAEFTLSIYFEPRRSA